MAYNISRDQLANDWLYETLKALNSVLEEMGMPLYVVGATARDMAMILLDENPSKRKTLDLDVAIAIPDWSVYDLVTGKMVDNGFEKQAAKQKFRYKGLEDGVSYEVDLVPFGDVAIDEKILWRPNGMPEMSVKCFNDVMAHAADVIIGGDCNVKIAPLAGQFLIKLDAWCDRHDRTFKDADDMMYILENYYMAKILSAPEVPEVVDVDNLDTLRAGAQWISADMCSMLSHEHKQEYASLLSKELELCENSELLQQLAHASSNYEDETFDNVKSAITEIRDILLL